MTVGKLLRDKYGTQEIMTGTLPFREILSAAIPVMVGQKGERPKRPQILGVTDSLWALWEQCWKANQNERPDMNGAARTLVSSLIDN